MESAAGVWGLDMHFEDPLLQRFYNTTCLYVVPALNVDGMLLGNHRSVSGGGSMPQVAQCGYSQQGQRAGHGVDQVLERQLH